MFDTHSSYPKSPTAMMSRFLRKVRDLLSSSRLALALLIIILISCLAGVTIIRGERAWAWIFSALWFNGLLAVMVVNVGFCFFGRIWGRKVTLVSAGMILFHISFIAVFVGVIYNSLFYFRGVIRLTEGEVLSSGDLQSYDSADRGRFFDLSKLRGETMLVRLHWNYTVDGVNKRAAYEILVGEGGNRSHGIIYVTKKLVHDGFQYFNDREGYSLQITLYDRAERVLYRAFVPLQSLPQKNGDYLYTTGTKDEAGSFPYPQAPLEPIYAVQAAYFPMPLIERSGDAELQVMPLKAGIPGDDIIAEGRGPLGMKLKLGPHYLSATEVRYWSAMAVRYEPGKPIVLASLWVGLAGMILTFIGRLIKSSSQSSAVGDQETP